MANEKHRREAGKAGTALISRGLQRRIPRCRCLGQCLSGRARGHAVTLNCSDARGLPRCARDIGRGRPAHPPRSRPSRPAAPSGASRGAAAGLGPSAAPHCRTGPVFGAGPSRASGGPEGPALPQLRPHGRGVRGPVLRARTSRGRQAAAVPASALPRRGGRRAPSSGRAVTRLGASERAPANRREPFA